MMSISLAQWGKEKSYLIVRKKGATSSVAAENEMKRKE
jgi:hypothetical protein